MIQRTYLQSALALGTTVELRLAAPDTATAEKHFAGLWNEVAQFESKFSRFKPESELNGLNRRAGEKTPISADFKKLLEASQYFSKATGGLFNPFILPALQRAGYTRSLVTASPSPDYSERTVVNPEALEVGDGWARIPSGTALDVGGIGKGYLADRLGGMLDHLSENYCLSLGGDMRVKGEDAGSPWIIDLQSAQDREASCGYFSDGPLFGIATSGAVREVQGHTQAHLIDPRTGEALQASRSLCTVVAEDAATADVFATCILMG